MTQQFTSISATDLVALAEQVVLQRGIFWFHSRGYSMEPCIGDGEAVAIEAVAPPDVEIGDILLCNTAEKPILHRVTHLHSTGKTIQLTLKSDVGNQIHSVCGSQVVGRLIAVRRHPVRLVVWHMRALVRHSVAVLLPAPMQKQLRTAKAFIRTTSAWAQSL